MFALFGIAKKLPHRLVLVLVGCLTLCLASCDKAKEMIDKGQEKLAEMQKPATPEGSPAEGNGQTVAPVVAPPAVVAPPVAPPKMSDDEILAGLLKLQPHEWKDASLKTLGELGEEARAKLEVLNLRGAQITEVGAANLAKLPNLKELAIIQSDRSLAVYEQIGKATSLERLILSNSNVNDEALIKMKGLINLKLLNLEQTPITDAGLSQLRQLIHLENLNISLTNTNGSGVKAMKNHAVLTHLAVFGTNFPQQGTPVFKSAKNLQVLSMGRCGATNETLADMKGLSNLQELSLFENGNVSDIGIVQLKGCTKLVKVNLMKTTATDKCLIAFKFCKDLQELLAGGTGITAKGAAALNKFVPDAKISLIAP